MKKLGLIAVTSLLLASITSSVMAAKVPTPNEPPKGVKIASHQDVIDIHHNGGIVYDVRWHYSEYEFEGHIPFAVSVPFTEWSKKNKKYDIQADSWDFSVLPQDKNVPMAFYCMGVNCWKSYKLADQAAKLGYKNVYWYKEGQPVWDKKGLPVINHNVTYKPLQTLFKGKNNPVTWLLEPVVLKDWFDKKEKIQVIDLRYKSFFEEGRLQNAFQVPLTSLLSRDGVQLMPKPQKGYKIVLVSQTGILAASAAVPLALLGYDVQILNGGMKAWTAKYGKANTVKGKFENNWMGKSGWKGQNSKLERFNMANEIEAMHKKN
ncbi:MAG: rhodanese-like domain-containing protein [Campylobacterota bacterium]|nr:rhodanese-like domain-containing protein [Campylobacterota bacterium]